MVRKFCLIGVLVYVFLFAGCPDNCLEKWALIDDNHST
jgi:hypothetical protein